MKAQDILNNALQIQIMQHQLLCPHDRVVVWSDDDRHYADCSDCGKSMDATINWNEWAKEQQERYEASP